MKIAVVRFEHNKCDILLFLLSVFNNEIGRDDILKMDIKMFFVLLTMINEDFCLSSPTTPHHCHTRDADLSQSH